jgi:hypothetical protein
LPRRLFRRADAQAFLRDGSGSDRPQRRWQPSSPVEQ